MGWSSRNGDKREASRDGAGAARRPIYHRWCGHQTPWAHLPVSNRLDLILSSAPASGQTQLLAPLQNPALAPNLHRLDSTPPLGAELKTPGGSRVFSGDELRRRTLAVSGSGVGVLVFDRDICIPLPSGVMALRVAAKLGAWAVSPVDYFVDATKCSYGTRHSVALEATLLSTNPLPMVPCIKSSPIISPIM